MEGHLKFLLEVQGLKCQNFDRKYEDKLEFPEGWGREKDSTKTPSVGGD